tara:strand:- start:4387 stop:4875 length:489 start_codon:yes stop_codon:yes gene_type:complete
MIPHDDAHALHSYDSALASRSALVLALRLGVFASLAFLCPPQISLGAPSPSSDDDDITPPIVSAPPIPLVESEFDTPTARVAVVASRRLALIRVISSSRVPRPAVASPIVRVAVRAFARVRAPFARVPWRALAPTSRLDALVDVGRSRAIDADVMSDSDGAF